MGLRRTSPELHVMIVAFDFDGTLSSSEMTVLLARRKGVAEEVEAITERAMNDEIGYAESLRRRVSLLEGLREEDASDAFGEVRLRGGAAGLLRDLGDTSHHVAVLTGGFEEGVRAALDRAGASVDSLVANTLGRSDGRLSGEVAGPLVEGGKDEALRGLARELCVDATDSVAVGDGANDLPMLRAAGYGVGFQPKSAVEPECDVVVGSMRELRSVLRDRGVL